MEYTDTRYGYHNENFNTGGTNDEEKMDYEKDNVPMDSYYKEVVVNAPVLPPKPKKPKAPPKKPKVNTLDPTRYVHKSGQQNACNPATMPQMRPQFHSQVHQQPPVRAESPEIIYEIPD